MKPIVFASLGASYFATYLAEITGQHFCVNGMPNSHDSYTRLYEASSPTHNLFMVGLYYPDHKSTKNFYKRSQFNQHIVLFAGGDLIDLYQMSAKTRNSLFRYLKKRRVIFATEAPHIQDHIKQQFGLDTEVIYLPSRHTFDKPTPLPEKFTVGCYLPFYRRPFYGWSTIIQVIRMMPDVQFHFYSVLGYETLPIETSLPNLICHPRGIADIPGLVAQMSCGLRITAHDTYSMTAIEYNLGGRWFLNNHPMPYCYKLSWRPEPLEVVFALREIQKKTVPNLAGHEHYQKFHTAQYFLKRLGGIYV